MRETIISSALDTTVKCEFLEYITIDKNKSVSKLRELVFDFFDAGKAFEASRKYDDIKEWANAVVDNLNPSVKGYSNKQVNLLLALIVNEQFSVSAVSGIGLISGSIISSSSIGISLPKKSSQKSCESLNVVPSS